MQDLVATAINGENNYSMVVVGHTSYEMVYVLNTITGGLNVYHATPDDVKELGSFEVDDDSDDDDDDDSDD
jgi:hypothetical protein